MTTNLTTGQSARHRGTADNRRTPRPAGAPQHRGGFPRALATALLVGTVLLAVIMLLVGVLAR